MNGNSASASEIVTGALQDLGKAVIVGTNTFGKGLVQTILPLGYDAQLKITTAKYYTPSGRCIQRIDYERRRDGEDAVTPDSLRKRFKTLDGRTVLELGGIAPDSLVSEGELSDYFMKLMHGNYFFNFATEYRSQHDSIGRNFAANKDLLNEFKAFVEKQNFVYSSALDQMIEDAREQASSSAYNESIYRDLGSVAKQVKDSEEGLFEKNSTEISRYLTTEIIGRFRGDAAQTESTLKFDRQTLAAESILESYPRYKKFLNSSN